MESEEFYTQFKKEIKDNFHSLTFFYQAYVKKSSDMTYQGMRAQLAGHNHMTGKIKKAVVKYLEDNLCCNEEVIAFVRS